MNIVLAGALDELAEAGSILAAYERAFLASRGRSPLVSVSEHKAAVAAHAALTKRLAAAERALSEAASGESERLADLTRYRDRLAAEADAAHRAAYPHRTAGTRP